MEPTPGQIHQIVRILQLYWEAVGSRSRLSGKFLGADRPDLPQMVPLPPASIRLGAPQTMPYQPSVIPLEDLRLGGLARC